MGLRCRIVSAGASSFVHPETNERFIKELHFWSVYDRPGTFNLTHELGIIELDEEIETIGQIYWSNPNGGIMYEMILYKDKIGYVPRIGGFTLRFI